jgi:hypothetical protein
MILAKFLPDRLTPIESKSHSPMENTAKTTSPEFFKLCLQINDLQSSLIFRAGCRASTDDETAVNVSVLGHKSKRQNETRVETKRRKIADGWMILGCS